MIFRRGESMTHLRQRIDALRARDDVISRTLDARTEQQA